MSIPTVNITATIYDDDGAPISGATISVKLSRTDVYQNQYVANSESTYTTDVNGVAVMPLFPNSLGENGTHYRVTATHPLTGKLVLNTTIYVQNFAATLAELAGTTAIPSASSVTSILPVAKGGTGGATATQARLNLGLGDSATKDVGAAAGTVAAGDHTHTTASLSDLGTGVATALAVNVGTAGAPVINGGALGTPTSGTLTNCTGLPVSTGVSGLGAGVATALAVNVGTAGAPVINGGALGTPSSGTVTNLTGTASININGTVGATTPAAGAFTTLTSTGNATLGDAEASDTHAIKGATTLLANSASAALTVTQTGSGNAFVVEDSASPDSTPFVIDSNGFVVSGTTSAYNSGAVAGRIQTHSTSLFTGASASYIWSNDAFQTIATMSKSRGAAIGTHVVVRAGDGLGETKYYGSDGTQFIQAAGIGAFVDGTPGTNDMPGRLVFSTTADGASTPTERMRIDSNGKIGIGAASLVNVGLYQNQTSTGATTTYGQYNAQTVQSDVTIAYRGYQSVASTQAASFTLGALTHFYAQQSTIGAGSTVTNQYGFVADGTLTGATNNYGFWSNIASGTGRWNFYAPGTASNFFAGDVRIGTAITSGNALHIANTLGLSWNGTSAYSASTSGTALFKYNDNTFYFDNYNGDLIFRRASYAESLRIDSSGNIGIGGAAAAGYSIYSSKAITGATTGGALALVNTVQSDVTNTAHGFTTYLGTKAAAFTLSTLAHHRAQQATIGAGSAVTTQHGFWADASLTGATNNFGFYSGIAAGTGRYNFYAAGTAANYFAGNVGVGKTATSALDTTSFSTNQVTNSAATYTVLATDSTIIQTTAASTYTLPAASSYTGRILHIVTQFAGAVISASSNVVPLAGGAAGTAILAATAGKYAKLQSNGTNWVIIEAN